MSGLWRSRWAAIGAAIAVTLGAGGAFTAGALIEIGERPVFIAVTPCRLIDTRPTSAVGPRTSPLGPNETLTLAARGKQGQCDLPGDAVAVVTNVTIVNPTAASYLTVFPADAAKAPKSSNLNWVAGQAPTPNQVTADLSSAGALKVYNRNGQVHVLIDVVGYYVHHRHDDRYYTEAEVDAAIDAAAASVDVSGGIFFDNFTFVPEATFSTQETITTDRAGYLLVNKLLIGSATCSPGAGVSRVFFITVDGIGVRSSASYVSDGDVKDVRLSGMTEEIVAAGEHTVAIAAECFGSNTASVGTTTLVSNTGVAVLPAG